MEGVAEGVMTTIAASALAKHHELEMPITEKIYQVLYEGITPREAVASVMNGAARHELAGRKWQLFSFLKRRKPT
jgi:glycerol-3-phosphate dehydrogenase (NAD(P)+)